MEKKEICNAGSSVMINLGDFFVLVLVEKIESLFVKYQIGRKEIGIFDKVESGKIEEGKTIEIKLTDQEKSFFVEIQHNNSNSVKISYG
ncbi:hypothetical protein ACFL05_00160 [Patescibacteria group bacterium]